MKLAYVVTESGCMDPSSGAWQHIQSGIAEFQKVVDVVPFLPDKVVHPSGPGSREVRGGAQGFRSSPIWGGLRDIRDLAKNTRAAWRVLLAVRRAGCRVAYVRIHFPSLLVPLFRIAGVKVFIEANGIQFEGRRKRFRSCFAWAYRPLEYLIYHCAVHTFFVGSQGLRWGLPNAKWTNVENGVEVDQFMSRSIAACSNTRLRLVLLARLVAHHRGEMITEALGSLTDSERSRIELHLVGSGFSQLKESLQAQLELVDHGFVGRAEIGGLLRTMDVGLIPDCPPDCSQMKLLDYAASGCLVLAPDVVHFVNFYKGRGVLLFKRRSPASLADAIRQILRGEVKAESMAQMLKEHIHGNYTWEKVFARKWEVMCEALRINRQ